VLPPGKRYSSGHPTANLQMKTAKTHRVPARRSRVCSSSIARWEGGVSYHHEIPGFLMSTDSPTDLSTDLPTISRDDFGRLAWAVRGMKAQQMRQGATDLEAEERALWHVAGCVAQHPSWHWLPIADLKLMLQGSLRQLERALRSRNEAGQGERTSHPSARPGTPSVPRGTPSWSGARRRRGGRGR
jgi:hypothetical protein